MNEFLDVDHAALLIKYNSDFLDNSSFSQIFSKLTFSSVFLLEYCVSVCTTKLGHIQTCQIGMKQVDMCPSATRKYLASLVRQGHPVEILLASFHQL